MAACRSCKSKELVTNSITGGTVCSSCGIVQDFNDYQHTFGGVSGPQGTFVRVGTAGAGTDYSYREGSSMNLIRSLKTSHFASASAISEPGRSNPCSTRDDKESVVHALLNCPRALSMWEECGFSWAERITGNHSLIGLLKNSVLPY